MRFYTETHQHYCGVDLHARNQSAGGRRLSGTLLVSPLRRVVAR